MESMEIKLKMLTPLWTGGVDGTMDRIHETGIIGSLRWWYEAVVRGLGGWACDPTRLTCSFDSDRYRQAASKPIHVRLHDAGLCDVCQVFGSTSWRRQVRFDIVDDRTEPTWTSPLGSLNVRPPDRNRGWFLVPGRIGNLVLRLVGDQRDLSLLASLFLFLERWGSIGAKPQLGYGIFRILNGEEVLARAEMKWEVKGNKEPDQELPDLRRFGFFRCSFEPRLPGWWTRVPGMERIASSVKPIISDHKTIPLVPALRNEWRFHGWSGSPDDGKWMFGTLKWRHEKETIRVRSKIAISWAYPRGSGWEVRGWAWLQKPRIAAKVWNLIQDKRGWEKVLGLQGDLETHPKGRWQELTAESVTQLLEGTR
ncbi:MAG: type III-B CRISPR module RAMP protein Cmr1 [Deltaproteobacteria bacterium]|nr:type III-B CRISPR module RAMP protein Cmr1 [Deltaproteobacteria bacterium]